MNCWIATGINPCCWLLEAMHSNKPSSWAAVCCHWPAAWYTLSLSRSGILRTKRAVVHVHVFLHDQNNSKQFTQQSDCKNTCIMSEGSASCLSLLLFFQSWTTVLHMAQLMSFSPFYVIKVSTCTWMINCRSLFKYFQAGILKFKMFRLISKYFSSRIPHLHYHWGNFWFFFLGLLILNRGYWLYFK